jgi:hypothetical protein
VSFYDALLGFSPASRDAVGQEPAHGVAGKKCRAIETVGSGGDPSARESDPGQRRIALGGWTLGDLGLTFLHAENAQKI